MLPMFDAFDHYCQWCRDRGQTPPTREWWDKACAQPRRPQPRLSDTQFDVDTERREGYAYD
jgi:hypothetical protein